VHSRLFTGVLHQKKTCQTLHKVNFDIRFLCIYFILNVEPQSSKKSMRKIMLNSTLVFIFTMLFQSSILVAKENATSEYTSKYPYIFHLVQKELWEKTLANKSTYYPPTYTQDKFTHATANPDFLLIIGNHFYKDVVGDWLCLRMSVDTLQATGVKTIFEGTEPVGDKQPDFPGTDSELFPHILGGISPSAVMQVHTVARASDGTFLSVSDIIDGE
jgi:uncharacterized protein (DUF952 family)